MEIWNHLYKIALGILVVGQLSLANAQPPRPPQMTDAQKKCFTDQGLTAPGQGKPSEQRPSREVMEKVNACLKANGFERPAPPSHLPGEGERRGPPPAPSSNGTSSSSDLENAEATTAR